MTANGVEIRSLVILAGGSEIPVNEHEDSILAFIHEHGSRDWLPLVEVVAPDKVAPAYVRCGAVIAIRPYAPAVVIPERRLYERPQVEVVVP